MAHIRFGLAQVVCHYGTIQPLVAGGYKNNVAADARHVV